MDGRPYHRNKAAFLNFSGVLWTLSKSFVVHLIVDIHNCCRGEVL